MKKEYKAPEVEVVMFTTASAVMGEKDIISEVDDYGLVYSGLEDPTGK